MINTDMHFYMHFNAFFIYFLHDNLITTKGILHKYLFNSIILTNQVYDPKYENEAQYLKPQEVWHRNYLTPTIITPNTSWVLAAEWVHVLQILRRRWNVGMPCYFEMIK